MHFNKSLLNHHLYTVMMIFVLFMILGCSPVIKTFDPEQGRAGTEVEINGKRFGKTPAKNSVFFNGVIVPQSDILYASKTKLRVKVPADAATGLIMVKTSKGTGSSDKNFIVPGDASWTFMVYMAADNDLEGAALDDFLEMASVPNSRMINIVVQLDRASGHSPDYGDWTDTRRFVIKNGNIPSMTPVQNLGEANMGDPAVLQDFVEWGIVNYPADYYSLVIWNHGGGWKTMKQRLDSMATTARTIANPDCGVARAIAVDDNANDRLYMKEVQSALETAKQRLSERFNTQVKLDLVGFDACLMGMIENAYALRNATNYMVGSEEEEPWDGWPYDQILQRLVNNPATSPRQLAAYIVDDYVASYAGQSDITQAAVDISKVNDLVNKLNAFTIAANTEWNILANARNSAQQYHPTGFNSYWGTDLCGFINNVKNNISSQDIKDAAESVRQAIQNFVLNSQCSQNMSGTYGTAIYFPPNQAAFTNDPDHTSYQDANTFMPVDFVRINNWDNWLQNFYANIP